MQNREIALKLAQPLIAAARRIAAERDVALGPSCATLMRRFGAPFPGHRHRHPANRNPGPAEAEPGDDADFDVIEPF